MAPTKTPATPTRRQSKRKAVHYKTKSARRSELREGKGRPPKATITPTPRQSKRKISVDETNSLRRSKRRKDGDGNMIVTPIAASTSIREGALKASMSGRTGRIYGGSKFSVESLQQKRDLLRKAQHRDPNDTFVERITRTTLPFSPEPIGHTTPPYPIETSTNKSNGNFAVTKCEIVSAIRTYKVRRPAWQPIRLRIHHEMLISRRLRTPFWCILS
jgi:hypothetical protein